MGLSRIIELGSLRLHCTIGGNSSSMFVLSSRAKLVLLCSFSATLKAVMSLLFSVGQMEPTHSVYQKKTTTISEVLIQNQQKTFLESAFTYKYTYAHTY